MPDYAIHWYDGLRSRNAALTITHDSDRQHEEYLGCITSHAGSWRASEWLNQCANGTLANQTWDNSAEAESACTEALLAAVTANDKRRNRK